MEKVGVGCIKLKQEGSMAVFDMPPLWWLAEIHVELDAAPSENHIELARM